MGGVDDEFEDFLKRRKPVFRAPEDLFEPPAELDRVVLRQAREAIQTERPVRVFHGPRWGTPVALAATVLLTFTVIFYAGMPAKQAPVPEVTVQNVSERVEISEAAAPMAASSSAAADNRAREDASASGTVMVDIASPMAKRESAAGAAPSSNTPGFVANDEAERHAAPPPPGAPMVAARPSESLARGAPPVTVTAPSATSTEVPTWRRDPNTWLAEIERLRNAGDTERAEAELAEFNRQRRAYAVGPDR